MTSREFRDRLGRRARKAGLTLPADLTAGLEAYFRLLELWNKKINLTALRLDDSADEAVDRLLIEPIAAAKFFQPQCRVIDLGSGGGSPAIPLKLALPDMSIHMVESKTRKSAFLREVVRQLELSNATVETARFEELLALPELHEAMDVVTMRAVRVESRTLMTLQAFVKPGGQIMLFRGPGTTEAPANLTPPLVVEGTHPLVESLRSRLVILRKVRLGARALG